MTLDELRTELRVILDLEGHPSVDWDVVKKRCLHMVARLNVEPAPAYPHAVVYHFLDDPDLRERDHAYGDLQRERLRHWLLEAA